ncbi:MULTISPECIES: EboA domain-containing protein [unclassified Embleya]|uniref:EboA domain-containing protein n=1 Tax=unclassified Embleya TaxID=2699296 RepID=UPI0033C4AA8D
MPHPPIAALRSAFTASAKPGSQDWPTLADFTAFAAAGRACGRAPLIGLPGWTCDDAARVLALAELADRTPEGDLSAHLRTLYWRGDAHERRAVLRALPYLAVTRQDPALATALVEDALRTGDPHLIAAAHFAAAVPPTDPTRA